MNTQENMKLAEQLENVNTEKDMGVTGSNLTKIEEAFIKSTEDGIINEVAKLLLTDYTRLQRTQWMKEIRRLTRLIDDQLGYEVTLQDLKEVTDKLIDLKYDKL